MIRRMNHSQIAGRLRLQDDLGESVATHTIISLVADSRSSGWSRSTRSMSHCRRVRYTVSPSLSVAMWPLFLATKASTASRVPWTQRAEVNFEDSKRTGRPYFSRSLLDASENHPKLTNRASRAR